MFTFILTILFGPIGFLFGIGNWRAKVRNRQLMTKLDVIDRRRLRLENPTAYQQLLAEDKAFAQKKAIRQIIAAIIVIALCAYGSSTIQHRVDHQPATPMKTVRQGGFIGPDGKAWVMGQPEAKMILEWQGIRGRIVHIDDSDVSVRWDNSPAIIDYGKAEFDNLLRRGEFKKQ